MRDEKDRLQLAGQIKGGLLRNAANVRLCACSPRNVLISIERPTTCATAISAVELTDVAAAAGSRTPIATRDEANTGRTIAHLTSATAAPATSPTR